MKSFNTQPREGGCRIRPTIKIMVDVSTHSHAKAAAVIHLILLHVLNVSTHSRTEAAASIA